jgi:hypothetical protein
MLRAKDASVTVGVVVETPTVDEQTAVLETLRNTIKSGIFPARLNSAGATRAANRSAPRLEQWLMKAIAAPSPPVLF